MSMLWVPSDVMARLLAQVDMVTVIRMQRVCKDLRNLLDQQRFWRFMYIEKWKLVPYGSQVDDFDWKRSFIQRFRTWDPHFIPRVKVSSVRQGERIVQAVIRDDKIALAFRNRVVLYNLETMTQISRAVLASPDDPTKHLEIISIRFMEAPLDQIAIQYNTYQEGFTMWNFNEPNLKDQLTTIPMTMTTTTGYATTDLMRSYKSSLALIHRHNKILLYDAAHHTPYGLITASRIDRVADAIINETHFIAVGNQSLIIQRHRCVDSHWELVGEAMTIMSPHPITRVLWTSQYVLTVGNFQVEIRQVSDPSHVKDTIFAPQKIERIWNDKERLILACIAEGRLKFSIYNIEKGVLVDEMVGPKDIGNRESTFTDAAIIYYWSELALVDMKESINYRQLDGHVSIIQQVFTFDTKLATVAGDHSFCIWDFETRNGIRGNFQDEIRAALVDYLQTDADPFAVANKILTVGVHTYEELVVYTEVVFEISKKDPKKMADLCAKIQGIPKFSDAARVTIREVTTPEDKSVFSFKTMFFDLIKNDVDPKREYQEAAEVALAFYYKHVIDEWMLKDIFTTFGKSKKSVLRNHIGRLLDDNFEILDMAMGSTYFRDYMEACPGVSMSKYERSPPRSRRPSLFERIKRIL
eukprot:TRINITY_DN7_c4_g1_i1.p1 TRINITY_DN7_c4_g1~~TRINITY_DN7_c4_g1_i1.p1  ORF type:complete len:639 (-),score=135.90 TRINITY_DN7_c4_g1_i1:261-2177(-)